MGWLTYPVLQLTDLDGLSEDDLDESVLLHRTHPKQAIGHFLMVKAEEEEQHTEMLSFIVCTIFYSIPLAK